MDVAVSKAGLEMLSKYNNKSKKVQPVLGICCAGFMGVICGVEPKTYYNKEDLKNNPSLELAIDNANRLACGFFNEKWTEAKQEESNEAVKNIKDLAEKLGVEPRKRQIEIDKAFDFEL